MKIGVVLVTFNRLEKLKKTLLEYDKQTFLPQYILVVNNFSNDGTYEFLKEWEQIEAKYKKKVINMEFNTGGAGGFYTGMREAEKYEAEWIWLSDDDAYPRNNTFEELVNTYNKINHNEQKNVVALCSAVYHDGKIDTGHRVRINKKFFMVKFPGVPKEEYNKDYFTIDILSYVGSAIKKSVLKNAGYVDSDFFIYQDDQEHSLRLRKYGNIICCPKSIIDHDTAPKKYQEVNWGRYYASRNKILMIKYHFSKWYYFNRIFLGYIRDVIFQKNKYLKKIYKASYKDAIKNKKGLHEIYKPGWKI